MTDVVIHAESLTKSYGKTRALDGFSLDVPTGQVAGFLGPNGAGKSTTIRILLGMLRADAGRVSVLGMDPWRQAVTLHRSLSYVPGDVTLWPNLSGGEVIDLLTSLHGGVARTERRDELIERFEFDPSKKARTYSKGNRQKVALIAALACDVPLYLLDEPTSGLDPLMEAEFRAQIRGLRDEGRTVLLSSHILGEVESLCDTVTIIRSGKVVESGTLAEMRHLHRSAVTLTSNATAEEAARWPGVHDIVREGQRLQFDIENVHLGAVLAQIASHNPIDLQVTPPSLEELFLRHYANSEPVDATETAQSAESKQADADAPEQAR